MAAEHGPMARESLNSRLSSIQGFGVQLRTLSSVISPYGSGFRRLTGQTHAAERACSRELVDLQLACDEFETFVGGGCR